MRSESTGVDLLTPCPWVRTYSHPPRGIVWRCMRAPPPAHDWEQPLVAPTIASHTHHRVGAGMRPGVAEVAHRSSRLNCVIVSSPVWRHTYCWTARAAA